MRVHINRIIGLLHVAAILKCPDLTRFKCPFGVSACWRVQVIRSPTMDTMRMITMTRRQISRLKTIQAVTEGNLKAVTAAAQLGLCRLQIDRMADRYRDDGPSEFGAEATRTATSSITGKCGRCGTFNHSGSISRFWSDPGLREAARTAQHLAR